MKKWLLTLGCLWSLAVGAVESEYDFALVGDTPYSTSSRHAFIDMLAALDHEPLVFIAHAGDFKSGNEPCSDALFADRLAIFSRSRHPFIFVPGDNEWTDCHRTLAGGYDPLERLGALRNLFFAQPRTLGQTAFELTSQPEVDARFAAYREHLRWATGPVWFVTLNIPGSQNNIGSRAHPSAEFVARSRAVASWLKAGFALARETPGNRGLVIIMQADPDFLAHAVGKASDGYRDFLNQLTQEVMHYPGEVLLVHGDTHVYKADKPLRHPTRGTVLENFTRVETFGHPFQGWVKVRVRPGEPSLFQVEPHAWP